MRTFHLVGTIGRYSKSKFPEKNLEDLTRILQQAQSGQTMTYGSKVQIPTPRNVRKRLGDGTLEELVTDYQKGDTTITLMERYSLSKTAVLKVLRDNGVMLRRQPLTPEQVEKARRLYEAGEPVAKVAAQIQSSSETTRLGLIAAGVRMRLRGRQAR